MQRAVGSRSRVQLLPPALPHSAVRRVPNCPGARVSFAQVGYDEAMRRAGALVTVLRERAAGDESLRQMSKDTESDLHRAGLFRFHQPRRWGGMELPFVALFDIPAEIGRGCASTAWNVANLAVHHWLLALYDPRAQDEVWSENPDALIASGLAAAGVGTAQAALELTREAIKERSTSYTAARMRDFQAVQLRVARAGAQIDAARLICRADCLEAQGVAEQDRLMTIEDKLRCRRNVAYAMELCTDAVDSLHAR